jgi:hypothetical protein
MDTPLTVCGQNDTLYPIHQESYEGYDLHVRTALFVVRISFLAVEMLYIL